jgi:hypothetical protein
MFNFRHKLAKAALVAGSTGVTAGLVWVGFPLDRAREAALVVSAPVNETDSHQTRPVESSVSSVPETAAQPTVTLHPTLNATFKKGVPSGAARGSVCRALRDYPKPRLETLSFHSNIVSNICQPFIKYDRADLDRCGDQKSDPYLSKFTWPTRQEMSRRGKVNVFTEAAYTARLPELLDRANALRERATDLCCASDDVKCRLGMGLVKFEVCKPQSDPNAPDPCVFGGTYRMPGSGYDSIFRLIARQRGEGTAATLREIAAQNLVGRSIASLSKSPESIGLASGSITLSSYISVDSGSVSMDPVILHELGHACSMVKMQEASVDESNMPKALRATQWLDSAKRRCDPNFKFPGASDDFWESVGETRELSSCLKDLATLNQKKQIDKPCNGLCPGHYLEESVGIAFSLLLGDLDGGASAVFPNTCDHVRDGQHPMVSDVAECLMQNSPRFRARMAETYGCEAAGPQSPRGTPAAHASVAGAMDQ